MSEKEKINKKDFINTGSHGFQLSQILYEKKESTDASSGNSIPINIRLRRDDVELFDAIAKKFNVSRSFLIGTLIEWDVLEMFDNLEIVDKDILARRMDKKLEANGIFHHNSNAYGYGYWMTRTLIAHMYLDHPDNISLLEEKLTKL